MSAWDYAYNPYGVPWIRRTLNRYYANMDMASYLPKKYRKYYDRGVGYLEDASSKSADWKYGVVSKIQKAIRGNESGRVPTQTQPVEGKRPRKLPKKNPVAQEQEPDPMKVNGFQSYPSTSCCVNIPAINLRRFGRRAWKGDNKLLENPNHYVEYKSGIPTSDVDKKTMRSCFSESVGLKKDPGAVIDSVISYGAAGVDFGEFNSVNQIHRYFEERALLEPTYASTSGINNPGSANTTVILDNQLLKLVFKNNTANPFGVEGKVSYTPIYLSVYVVQYKKDCHMQLPTVAANDHVAAYLAAGFRARYETDERLAKSGSQDLLASFKENVWCQEYLKVCAVRRVCLSPGQEAHLDIFLNVKQCLSSKFKLNASAIDGTRYNPVIKKKGQIGVFIEFHGGFEQHGGTTGFTAESTKLGIHGSRQWDAYQLAQDSNEWERNNDYNISVGSLVGGVDIAHNTG